MFGCERTYYSNETETWKDCLTEGRGFFKVAGKLIVQKNELRKLKNMKTEQMK